MPGSHQAPRQKLLDDDRRDDGEIRRLPGVDLVAKRAHRGVGELNRVAALLLETPHHVPNDGLDGSGGQHIQLHGGHLSNRGKQQGGQRETKDQAPARLQADLRQQRLRNFVHGTPPYLNMKSLKRHDAKIHRVCNLNVAEKENMNGPPLPIPPPSEGEG